MTKRGKNSLKQKARQIARREGINYSAALARLSSTQHCEPHQTECGNSLPDVTPFRELTVEMSLFRTLATQSSPYETVFRKLAAQASPYETVMKKVMAQSSPYETVFRKLAAQASPYETVMKKVMAQSSPYETVFRKLAAQTSPLPRIGS